MIIEARLQFVVEPLYRRPRMQHGENIKVLFVMVAFLLSNILTELVLILRLLFDDDDVVLTDSDDEGWWYPGGVVVNI